MKTSGRFARLHRLLIAGAAALGLTVAMASPPLVFADQGQHIIVPEVPDLDVPVGNELYREGHAEGTQNYICMACPKSLTDAHKCPASGFAWVFVGPQATLFVGDDGDERQIITHFNSPNPVEGGKERPTWQDSRDTSAVWGKNDFPPAKSASVTDGAIPWLLLPFAGTQAGPTGGDRLTQTTFIQRLNTVGGVAPPASECASEEDAGKKALQPYRADYFFYRSAQ